MANILAPSILSADFWRLGEELEAIGRAGAQYVHFDVMDGRFVPSISFGLPVLASLKRRCGLVMDVHLMIEEPIRYVGAFAKAGADIITFHLEAATSPQDTIDRIRQTGCRVGMSIKPGTSVEALYPYMGQLDMALIMTVEPGFGGQVMIESCLDKARVLRDYLDSLGLQTDIEADGGIHAGNVEKVLAAGVNVVVAGSALFGEDTYGKTLAMWQKLQAGGK